MTNKKEQFIIGIGGRSGSGKSSLVQGLMRHLGAHRATLHTMDNYYLPRHEQKKDELNYINFDLPSSFYMDRFIEDLHQLSRGETVEIHEYAYNNETNRDVLRVKPAPVILVEGLFIFHHTPVRNRLDYKVFVDLAFEEAFQRRVTRDLNERNYDLQEITHRYHFHAEPAYKKYIEPYKESADLIVRNEDKLENSIRNLSGALFQLMGLKD